MIKAFGIRQCFLKYSRLIEKNLIWNCWLLPRVVILRVTQTSFMQIHGKHARVKGLKRPKKRAFSGAVTTVIAYPFHRRSFTLYEVKHNKWKTSDFPNPVGKTPNTSSAFLNTRLFQLFPSGVLLSFRAEIAVFASFSQRKTQSFDKKWHHSRFG